jgi:uncharacterized protein (DUF1501 family)
MSGLLDDLQQRGLLDDTLVIATGEFGRTPRVNDKSGRDHWPGCWSAIVAGAKTAGGKVIGRSDSIGSEPIDRPVHPSELAATLLDWCGVDGTAMSIEVDKHLLPLVPYSKLTDLWNG